MKRISTSVLSAQWALLGAAICALPLSDAQAAPASAPVTVPAVAAWKTPMSADEKILNLLNRLTFGPRPGDVARVKAMGASRWLDEQLDPASLPDADLERQLASLSMVGATPELLMLAYRADNGNIKRALQNRQLKAKAADNPAINPDAAPMSAAPVEAKLNARDQEILDAFRASGMEAGASAQALGELTAAKLACATDSTRQLQEVLADFWGNHFNVDINKKAVGVLKVSDDREVIRPHEFGTFRELLGASAHSPAMLIYLDNASSTAQTKTRDGKARGGLNENYGREIMELHTLGVDGGYSQTDVTEVARCFTGWGLDARGAFRFAARQHDNGAKTVLGHAIPAGGGQKDGELVLDILAAHPATAHHIAFELCQRFIADEPPATAVDRVARAFSESNGDLKRTYRALFESPEFNSRGAYRAKIKSPLEYAVSAVRALDGHFALPDPDNPRQRLWLIAIGRSARGRNNGGQLPRRPLATEIAQMGQPLWGYQAPTGYSENSQSWVSSSALVSRLNYALSLTQGRIGDVALGKDTFANAPVAQIARNLLSAPPSAQTLATIEAEVKVAPGDGAKIRALILGSPEFQRR